MPPTPETITITVDSKSTSHFTLPTTVLLTKSTYFHRLLTNQPTVPLTLPTTPTCDFHDFVQYLYTGRILPLPHNRAPYCVESHARRLVKALALGILLESSAYQHAAVVELHGLAHNLAKPEELVNEIFAVKGKEEGRVARRLIVAVVAAKTGGVKGKGKGKGDWLGVNVERGERIKSSTFWGMYDEYCWRKGGCCRYPVTLQEAIA